MKISFACPSCGAPGSVDASLAGKLVRCKPCNYRFAIPEAGEHEADGYGLDAPTASKARDGATGPDEGSVFAPARGDSPVFAPSPMKRKAASSARHRRMEGSGFDLRTWPIRGGAAVALGLVGIALFAPNGLVVAGSVLMILGLAMVLVGYGAGAYGAFSEDVLYGLLYLLIPLYAAYYLVTRWEDLRAWFACSIGRRRPRPAGGRDAPMGRRGGMTTSAGEVVGRELDVESKGPEIVPVADRVEVVGPAQPRQARPLRLAKAPSDRARSRSPTTRAAR